MIIPIRPPFPTDDDDDDDAEIEIEIDDGGIEIDD